jgi:polysaccharide pyruvyl transferase WcaK-like protein
MKIIHLASFLGNIGDNASHIGLKKVLDSLVGGYVKEEVEIRRFYTNYNKSDSLRFDDDFLAYLQTFDLWLIGGGGYLDNQIEGSATGTTLDMSKAFIDKLDIPTIIISSGSMAHREKIPGNDQKLKSFLGSLLEKENVKIAFRNDGTAKYLEGVIGADIVAQTTTTLDSGFFYDTPARSDHKKMIGGEYVAINITSDQLVLKAKMRESLTPIQYNNELKLLIDFIVHDLKLQVVLVPHIYHDLKAISELLSHLDEYTRRSHVLVAPCYQGNDGANEVLSIYKSAKFVFGSRFHTNVVSISMGVPVLGLAVLDRIQFMYESLNSGGCVVQLKSGFSKEAIRKISNNSFNAVGIGKELAVQREFSLNTYKGFLNKLGLS